MYEVRTSRKVKIKSFQIVDCSRLGGNEGAKSTPCVLSLYWARRRVHGARACGPPAGGERERGGSLDRVRVSQPLARVADLESEGREGRGKWAGPPDWRIFLFFRL